MAKFTYGKVFALIMVVQTSALSTLKLTNVSDISWIDVFSPVWMPLIVVAAIVTLYGVCLGGAMAIHAFRTRRAMRVIRIRWATDEQRTIEKAMLADGRLKHLR